MSGLAGVTTAYALMLAVALVVAAAVVERRPAVLDAALGVCGVAAAGVAIAAVMRLANGHRSDELATHLGYVATAPALLPAAAGVFRSDKGRWSTAGYAVACLVLAVVLIRLVATAHG